MLPYARTNAAMALDDRRQYVYVFGDFILEQQLDEEEEEALSSGIINQCMCNQLQREHPVPTAKFDCVWRYSLGQKNWERLPVLGAEENYPDYEFNVKWPPAAGSSDENNTKDYAEYVRDLAQACGVDALDNSASVQFLSYRAFFDQSGEKMHFCRFFMTTLASDCTNFVQNELPLNVNSGYKRGDDTAVMREFADKSLNFFQSWPVCCIDGMGRRHFIFLYIEEFEFNVEEIEDEEPLEGKQHQPQPNATTTRKQYYSFDIFKLSEPTNNTQTGIHTAVQHHHHHDQEQNPDYKNCAWRISKISENANRLQLHHNLALRTEIQNFMGPAESITCFAFSTYIGFLLLKGFDNSDYYPLDKILLFDIENEEFTIQTLSPDQLSGFPRGYVHVARYRYNIRQQSSDGDGVTTKATISYELHMPGGIYYDFEQEEMKIYDQYWILDLTTFKWRFVGHLAQLKLRTYTTAYSQKNSTLCVFGGASNLASFVEELSNSIETIQTLQI